MRLAAMESRHAALLVAGLLALVGAFTLVLLPYSAEGFGCGSALAREPIPTPPAEVMAMVTAGRARQGCSDGGTLRLVIGGVLGVSGAVAAWAGLTRRL